MTTEFNVRNLHFFNGQMIFQHLSIQKSGVRIDIKNLSRYFVKFSSKYFDLIKTDFFMLFKFEKCSVKRYNFACMNTKVGAW